MLCQKTLTYVNPDADITLFSFFTFAVPAVVFALMLIPEKMRLEKAGGKCAQCADGGGGKPSREFPGRSSDKPSVLEKLDRAIYLPVLLLAIAVFIINQFATSATAYVSSAVLFSLINGGNTIIAAVIAAVCFKEKPTARSVAGLVLGLGALLVINAF